MNFLATNSGPATAFALSLAGGVIVLIVGIVGLAWFGMGGPAWSGFGDWMRGMMGGSHGFMFDSSGFYSLYAVFSVLSIISGAVMIVGSAMLRARPQDHMTWGIAILIFSIVSLAGMGGYFIGAILGIIGGAFAIAYRPRTTAPQTPPAT